VKNEEKMLFALKLTQTLIVKPEKSINPNFLNVNSNDGIILSDMK